MSKRLQLPMTYLILAAITILLLVLPNFFSGYSINLILEMLKWIGLAQSWYIFSGMTGYPSLAHSGFFGLGAYVTALLWPTLPLPVLVPAGAAAAAAAAWVVGIPVLRVRGPYFVILTLGLNVFVLHAMSYYDITVRGNLGHLLLGVPALNTIYQSVTVLTGLCVAASLLIYKSRFGLGLLAIRENEPAALASGINAGLYKWLAFGISGAFAGAMGSLFALRWTYIDPSIAFDLQISFMVMIMALFGGQSSLLGPIIGAVILTGLKTSLSTAMPHGHLILLGGLLVVLVMFLPQGLLGGIDQLRLRMKQLTTKPAISGQVTVETDGQFVNRDG